MLSLQHIRKVECKRAKSKSANKFTILPGKMYGKGTNELDSKRPVRKWKKSKMDSLTEEMRKGCANTEGPSTNFVLWLAIIRHNLRLNGRPSTPHRIFSCVSIYEALKSFTLSRVLSRLLPFERTVRGFTLSIALSRLLLFKRTVRVFTLSNGIISALID